MRAGEHWKDGRKDGRTNDEFLSVVSLGMMVAWTPGLVVLAVMLAHANDPDPQRR
jgi:hypothetical protein